MHYLQFHGNSLSKVFFYLKNAFGFNHRENFLKWDLLSQGCCLTIVHMAGWIQFFSDSTHHIGFPLSPFIYLCMYLIRFYILILVLTIFVKLKGLVACVDVCSQSPICSQDRKGRALPQLMIPHRYWSPDRKWSSTTSDPQLSTSNDPERKIRMAWTQVTGSSCHVDYRNKKY